ncbi:hypothetical protein C7H85_06415 [Zobellella endophytica]|uniref:Flagellar protein FliT n=1 Tax=Zobellella endophytica TaxID=2116700 RepID=A0A2P7R7W5_9GAMM|nr:hypothetical protein [Zobellella endophytica]PSJ46273.1 hypothetical protein C7H85_06415 [Zobellella endophytica]
MTPLDELSELDTRLLAALQQPDSLEPGWLDQQLARRAALLARVIEQAQVSAEQASELVARSRRVKEAAEQTRQWFADRLARMQKGRRSVKAYQNIKRNQE